MKKLIYLIVLIVILSLVLTGCFLSNVGQIPTTEQSGISYLTKSPGPDLVGLWHFDGDALDSSGNGNDGTITGATYVGSANAMFGDALSFDGVNDYVEAPDAATLRLTSDMTVEAWVYISALASDWVRVVGKGDPTYRNYGLWYHGPSGKVLFQIYSGTGLMANAGTTWGTVVNDLTVSTETWYHFAGVKEGSTIYLYLDSVLVASAPITFTPATSSDPLRLGYAGFHSRHNGLIDEVRIWDEALTVPQIAQSFALGTLQPDATVVELGQEFFGDEVVIFTSSFYGLDGTCSDPFDPSDTIDIYMMSNYGETISNVSARKKPYTPNRTEGCWGNVIGTPEGTSISVDVGKYDCKSIHLSLDLTSGRSVGFNAQFLPYD